jgi:outer membrane lipoprotein SlyB
VTERHTVRDAAIGAGAGAVLGAVVAGRGSRTKGAIIGGAAGAVIGGVIGHTVDKKERVVYLAGPVLY